MSDFLEKHYFNNLVDWYDITINFYQKPTSVNSSSTKSSWMQSRALVQAPMSGVRKTERLLRKPSHRFETTRIITRQQIAKGTLSI